MVNLLPAVLLGGPPHAGKSVLLYNLTHALQERGVRHHAMRACPDGEGNWSQEGDPETVSKVRIKGYWSSEFIKRISFNLEHRCLPFLVDMGGRPQAAELPLLRQCTHSVLLLRADKPDYTQLWRHMGIEANLLPLAELTSQQNGTSTITSHSTLLTGTITGLERQANTVREDPVFMGLVKRIAALFNSYAPHNLERTAHEQAPTELIDLPTELHTYTTTSIWWEPEMLVPFLERIPEQTSLSIHGKGPNWLYAALASHAGRQPLYLFDPKLPFGWVQPVRVFFGSEQSPEVRIEQHSHADVTVLSITFPLKRLEYLQPDPLAFPPVPSEKGLIIDGPLPFWLTTALVRLYKEAGVAWIALYYPQRNRAVVAYSRVETHRLGEFVSLPA